MLAASCIIPVPRLPTSTLTTADMLFIYSNYILEERMSTQAVVKFSIMAAYITHKNNKANRTQKLED